MLLKNRSNNKPHLNKVLHKAIKKQSRFENKFNETKNLIDISSFKKQRDNVFNLNKQAKFDDYFSSYNSGDSKPFWVSCKVNFSNNYNRADTDIVLNENCALI